MVTEPLTALVLMAKLLVLAAELTLLTTEVTLLASPVGSVSLKLAPLTVLGPALLSTSTKFTVPPAVTLALLTVLLICSCAAGDTVMVRVEVQVRPSVAQLL